MRKRSLRDDCGSAFVELALVLPLLCLVLIGAVELGRMAYAAIEVSNAARAAVAYGAQNSITAKDDGQVMEAAAAADAANLTAMGATLHTTPNRVCVCDTGSSMVSSDCSTIYQYCCPPAEMTAGCTTSGTVVDYVQATTSATVKTIFNYPGIPPSFTLHGFAQMRVLQD